MNYNIPTMILIVQYLYLLVGGCFGYEIISHVGIIGNTYRFNCPRTIDNDYNKCNDNAYNSCDGTFKYNSCNGNYNCLYHVASLSIFNTNFNEYDDETSYLHYELTWGTCKVNNCNRQFINNVTHTGDKLIYRTHPITEMYYGYYVCIQCGACDWSPRGKPLKVINLIRPTITAATAAPHPSFSAAQFSNIASNYFGNSWLYFLAISSSSWYSLYS